jgi:type II secretory pathway pseudopilin PulG
MIRLNKDRRRGITLLEVMVLMTAVAAMLGMTVIVLQLAMRLQADSRGRIERSTAFGRLAQQFRLDVHSSNAIEAAEDGLRIEPNAERSIAYKAEADGKVSRIDTVGGKVAARETFIVPQTGAFHLSLRELDGRRFAVLGIEAIARKNRIDPERTYEVLALVGKDQLSPVLDAGTEGGKP